MSVETEHPPSIRPDATEQTRRRRVTLAAAALVVAAFVAAAAWQTCGFDSCPDVGRLALFEPGGAPELFDRDGEAFADLAPPDLDIVRLDDLPEYVPAAFLAVEDKRFYEHGGVDWWRAGGAALANVRRGRVAQGFSTVTMQLARSGYPERLPVSRRTLRRKLLEIRVAREIESRYAKDEILELFLNSLYLGNAVRGVGAAAREYFGVEASRLTVAQAATLAAMARSPGFYDPRRNPQAAMRRRDEVLRRMEEQKRIAPELAALARRAPLEVASAPRRRSVEAGLAPYAVERVRHLLDERLGEDLYREPLRVFTTIDSTIQRAAEEELAAQIERIEAGRYGDFDGPKCEAGLATRTRRSDGGDSCLEGAVIVLDPRNGDVLAWIGGRDYARSRFDRAALGQRQAGSAFKPFVYAAALERGFALSQRIDDSPLTLTNARGETWTPQDMGDGAIGRPSLRDALVHSDNIATVRLAQAAGLDAVRDLARRAGLQRAAADPSLALGTVDVSPVALAAAYTALAAAGVAVQPRFVARVESRDGEVVWSSKIVRRRVLDAGVASLVTDVLEDAVRRGTGRAAAPSVRTLAVAGKTGTTDEVHDAWFAGYTPDLVAVVWIGFDQPRPVARDATAAQLAAPVFARLADRIYQARPTPQPWPRPDSVREIAVHAETGLAVASHCRAASGARSELVLAGREPATWCPGEPVPDGAFYASLESGGTADGGMFARLGRWWQQRGRSEPRDVASLPRSQTRRQHAAPLTPSDALVPPRDGNARTRPAPPASYEPAPAPYEEDDVFVDASSGEEKPPHLPPVASERPAAAGRPLATGDERRPAAPGPARLPPKHLVPSTPQEKVATLPASGSAAGKTTTFERGAIPDASIDARDEPLAPDERAVPGPLDGWWTLSTRIDRSSVGGFRGLRLGYRIRLDQHGQRVTGRGQKWSENGSALSGAGRTAIVLDGRVDGDRVVLQFREQGTRRSTAGTIVLTRSEAGLGGSFRSEAADSSGVASATRLH